MYLCFEHHKLSAIYPHYIREKTDISMAAISKTQQLTPKKKKTTKKKQIIKYVFLG